MSASIYSNTIYIGRLPSKHTASLQRRYNVAATSRRCSDVVTTLLRHCVFAGLGNKWHIQENRSLGLTETLLKTAPFAGQRKSPSAGLRWTRFPMIPKWPQPSGHATLRQRRINVDATSWRCIDVDATLYKRHMPAGNLFVLRFYGPVNPMGSCRARSVYLTTRLLGRLSPLSG